MGTKRYNKGDKEEFMQVKIGEEETKRTIKRGQTRIYTGKDWGQSEKIKGTKRCRRGGEGGKIWFSCLMGLWSNT